jgi:hypothetical protein
MKKYWSTRNKAAYSRQRRDFTLALIRAAKDRPCALCGKSFSVLCMDFHHRDPSTKLFSLGHSHAQYRPNKVLKEIEKCDVYCANCHRLITHKEK